MEPVREPDDLYGLPLEEFTAARNALARSLKDEGRADDAAAVKKPPVSAWAVNQLARDDPDGIATLLDLVDRLKEARSAADIHELGSQRRELVAKLTRRAGQLAEAAGHAASATTLQRVTQTLQAGAEEDERDLLRRGALPDDLDPAGFDALDAFGSFDAFTHAPEPDDDAASEVEELKRLAAEAEEEAARLSAEAERAEAAALEASEAASEARRRAREAREKAQKAARSR